MIESLKNKTNTVLAIIKQDAPILFFIALMFIMLVYSVKDIVLATHDDLFQFIYLNIYGENFIWEWWLSYPLARGRFDIISLLGQFLVLYIFENQNRVLYFIILFLPILINVSFFSYIISKRTNRYAGYIIALFFFAFAQVGHEHNLFISFFYEFFQLGFFIFLIALELLLRYYENGRKKKHLVLSAVFMLYSYFCYEPYVAYTAVFITIMLLNNYCVESKKLNFRIFVRDTRFHMLFAVIYLLVYMLMRRLIGLEYDGMDFSIQDINIIATIKTTFSFGTANLPLTDFINWEHYRLMGLTGGFAGLILPSNMITFVTSAGLAGFVNALIAAFTFVLILNKSQKIDTKTLTGIIIISIVAMFVFCIPQGMTPKFQQYVERGIRGYTVSFFSYFWITCVLSLLSVFLYNKIKFKKTVLIISTLMVFAVTIATGFTNAVAIEQKNNNTIKYEMFDRITSTEVFGSYEDGAVIYTDGYIGVHLHMSTLGQYSEYKTGKKFTFTRDIDKLKESEDKYFLKYDTNSKIIITGKIDENFVSDEIFILPYEFMTPASLIAQLDDEYSYIYLNENYVGFYHRTVNIPQELRTQGMTVYSEGINIRSVRMVPGFVVNNILAPE